MKILKLLFVGIILFLTSSTKAQVSVNVNIGSPPLWGPVGYTEERYYYLPDVEAYYDVQTSMFIYYGGGVWLHRSYLPTRYRNYDLYNGYKVVVVGYRGDNPNIYFNEYKVKYKKGYRGAPQKNIGMNPNKGNYKSNENRSGGSNSNKGNYKSPEKRQGGSSIQGRGEQKMGGQNSGSGKSGSKGGGGKGKKK